jgi:hypothetical protein
MQVGSAVDAAQDVRVSWIEYLLKKVKAIKPGRILAGGGFGFALAASLLLIFFMPKEDNLQRMLSSAYADLPQDGVRQFNSFASRGEDQNEDQNLDAPPSEAMSLYLKGIAAGKARLSDPSGELTAPDSQKSRRALFFSLGQWTVLLQCACLSDAPVSQEFWTAQQTIALNLQDEFQHAAQGELPLQSVVDAVAMLKETVTQISASGNAVDGCEDITVAVEDLERRLR